ncbi:hypothetical protein ADL15_08490 [Actinoplanes awajinensis subsp. mycoplanecinus]|uniref:GGDEF domain-containing protein n=1 Tax=Actinoplanes awajinensis subsp. mycoplanecinus TaxID=135947 RepID=A0A0X3V5U6_9ACTN|nr:hypothetical protein ADL15_08490 [Actinoplanes awajinensis subsp. mycoplanecinus]
MVSQVQTLRAGTAERDLEAELEAIEERPRLSLDPSQVLDQVRGLVVQAQLLGRDDLCHRTRLVEADLLGRMGDVPAAARILHDVHTWAVTHQDPWVLVLSSLRLSLFFGQVGDYAAALEHAVLAMESVDVLVPAASTQLRFRCMMALANAYGDMGDFAAARERYADAERLSAEIPEPLAHLRLLNNLAFTELQSGDVAAAAQTVTRILAHATRHDLVIDEAIRETIARISLSTGHAAQAIEILLPIVRKADSERYDEVDSGAACLVTLAAAYRAAGDLDRAETALRRCRQLCADRGLVSVDVEAQREQAEVLAAGGRFEEALAAYKEFYAASMQLNTVQRDARARVLQAMYETGEARRLGEQARELSLRDPLTGLYNRRFVDAELPLLFRRAAESGTMLSLAVVDLDHFKRINDTCSHEAGDQVLQRVAELLDARAQTLAGSFAARLGGEEFLLVMPGTGEDEAMTRMRALCQSIREHDWRPVTGAVPVTASVGVSSFRDGHGTETDLLREADALLYRSKADGRDRVTGSAGAAGYRCP